MILFLYRLEGVLGTVSVSVCGWAYTARHVDPWTDDQDATIEVSSWPLHQPFAFTQISDDLWGRVKVSQDCNGSGNSDVCRCPVNVNGHFHIGALGACSPCSYEYGLCGHDSAFAIAGTLRFYYRRGRSEMGCPQCIGV